MLRSFALVSVAVSIVSLVSVAGSAFAQGAPVAPAVVKPGEAAALIPRSVLFGNPDRASLRLSPDGTKVAFVAPVAGVLNVWVGPANKLDDARPVTKDAGRGIRTFFWGYTSTDLIYSQDVGGDENFKIFRVDLASGDVRDLTPFETIPGADGKPVTLPNGKPLRPAARVEGVSHRDPQHILIGLNNRDPSLHDVYKVNLRTGDLKLHQRNDGFAGFVFDDDYNVKLATKQTEDGGSQVQLASVKPGPDGVTQFTDLYKVGMEDALSTNAIGLSKDGKTVYMTDSRGRNTAALMSLDLATGKSTLLAEDARCDVDNAMIHPTQNTVQAASFDYKRSEWKVIDPSIEADFAYLRTVAEGEFNVTSRTLDDSKWVVSYLMDNGPARSYIYDRKARKANFMFSSRRDLEGLALTKLEPVVIKSRDGLDLVSYLSLPLGSDADNDGRPDKPLPMVLDVHGGPWARDSWGFNPQHQWLANRGYAVLSVNFRGSTGFGKAFLNAGNRQWAAKMHDDLLDAVNWAVAENIADKQKVAIMGGSYGGYATLVGLTFTPDVFACGVDIVGPSNLVTLLSTIPPYWMPLVEQFSQRVGDFRTEEGKKFLESRSPLNFVDRITKPLLIGQGANDPRVKQTEADQIVKAMNSKNIPVTYVLFPDEGHGFARPPNRTAFYAVTEAFLAQHLGGRFQPIGDDFKGSSIKVPSGAEWVPDLKAAIDKAASK